MKKMLVLVFALLVLALLVSSVPNLADARGHAKWGYTNEKYFRKTTRQFKADLAAVHIYSNWKLYEDGSFYVFGHLQGKAFDAATLKYFKALALVGIIPTVKQKDGYDWRIVGCLYPDGLCLD